ncbi:MULTISPECIES: restriction endonuclease subunit S [unclassified Microcoleus]|uniref:restriction endonuclease subunit S n=1 Tax=unclassified Microcoleus TaxID=2642155 RepID=UPI001E078AFA|nr:MULTISPECIES: restriction endonuclease subunit S [unclassified Microcoleus]MCC3473431.1 restriction endonuclease subunit S [Microcoleus sp. PH2017_13_LAR_U_A]MCC3505576.1 restriction endonuclease subunit S [Microcoleus sp. PH2017_19_SFW_U_A]MCC3485760.1 restriction endonuclease subunit S [Microcoleus sp. PH2017_14_LAR_D_A]MCC3498122.1 restriction endonuclease subunit S [Microcoleus sp. PH2017_15_JOR_U_A]MCC3554359.1 restriction endonuclease subunit S [Microcoleus sp. PH2017_35_SFW_U_B]
MISEERKLPSTWRWVRCQDVVDVRDGTHDTPTKTNFGIPLITSKNLTPQGIDFSNITYISEEDYQSIEKRSAVDDGDVLFAMIGTIGNPVIVKKDRQFSIKNVALFKLNKSLYYPPFFKELLNTSIIRKQLARNTKGGNQKFVSLSVLRDLVIPLPPLEEQKRIAEILDRAQSLISKRREAIGQLDTLTQAIFIEMFGDPVTNPKGWSVLYFNNLLSMPLRNGLSPSNIGKVMSKVLTLSAITGSAFDENAWKTSTFQSVPPITQRVDQSDFLICRGNGNIQLVGKGYFPTQQMPEVTFPDTMIAARILPEVIERQFLQHIWNSSAVRRQLETLARTTNGTFKVNQTMLEGVLFVVPPLPLQQEFARRAEAVEKLKTAHRTSLSELHALFASLQHRAFRGEL